MKKLKCESCGATLTVDENHEFAKCKYCNSVYKLNEDVNVNIKLNNDSIPEFITNAYGENVKVSKVFIIIFLIVFMGIFATAIVSFINFNKDFDVKKFNNQYEISTGTSYKLFVDSVLDNISTNNKTNKRKITVKYNGNEYNTAEEIKQLKKSLSDITYELSFDYDSKGYINILYIEEA